MQRVCVFALITGALTMGGCSSCSKKTTDASFSCSALQLRAKECRAETLDIVKRGIDQNKAEAGGEDTERQYKMFEKRFDDKLAAEQTRKLCEKFSGGADPSFPKRADQMKDCYAKVGCDAFSRCMLEL